MATNRFPKHPDALLDFGVDWTKWLAKIAAPGAADTIATSTWTVPAGITNEGENNNTQIAAIWLSGGTDGTEYTLTNTITTAGGREDYRSIVVVVQEAEEPDGSGTTWRQAD